MYFRRLADLRDDNDKTLAYIGKILNCNPEVYRRYEKGIREIPTWALIKLAVYYNTSVDYLVGLTDNPHPYERAAGK